MTALYTLFIMLAGMFWGMISLFSTPLKNVGVSPGTIVAIRMIGGAIVLIAVFAVKNADYLKIKLKDVWLFIGTGVISTGLFNYCYFTALELTSTAVAVVLLYTSPLFVIVMSAIFFKEKITKIKVVSLIMTMLGCVCVTGLIGAKLNGNVFGIVAGLGSGFFYSLYSIFGRVALKKYNSVTVTIYTFVFAAIASLFMADFSEFGYLIADYRMALDAVLFVIISTVTPFMLYTKGLSKTEAGTAAILVTIEPVVGVIVGFFVFGESTEITKIIGIFLIIGASIVLNIRRKRVK